MIQEIETAAQKIAALMNAGPAAMRAALGLEGNDPTPLETIWRQFAQQATAGSPGGFTRRLLAEGADYTKIIRPAVRDITYPEAQAMTEGDIMSITPGMEPGTVLYNDSGMVFTDPWEMEPRDWDILDGATDFRQAVALNNDYVNSVVVNLPTATFEAIPGSDCLLATITLDYAAPSGTRFSVETKMSRFNFAEIEASNRPPYFYTKLTLLSADFAPESAETFQLIDLSFKTPGKTRSEQKGVEAVIAFDKAWSLVDLADIWVREPVPGDEQKVGAGLISGVTSAEFRDTLNADDPDDPNFSAYWDGGNLVLWWPTNLALPLGVEIVKWETGGGPGGLAGRVAALEAALAALGQAAGEVGGEA